jgi:hypothetical protein
MLLKDFIGKEVQIYPGDTHSKFGIVTDITDQGVVFKITEARWSERSDYKKGDTVFIAFSNKLNFKLKK